MALICYQGGKENVLVKGWNLGGRAKRIFVDVVKENLRLVGTGGVGGC